MFEKKIVRNLETQRINMNSLSPQPLQTIFIFNLISLTQQEFLLESYTVKYSYTLEC